MDYGLFGNITSLSVTLPPAHVTTLGVEPIAECVIDNLDGTYTASFRYNNPNTNAVTVPAGNRNGFSPNPVSSFSFEQHGQPTTFEPGVSPGYPSSTLVTWDGDPFGYGLPYSTGSEPRVWYLDGKTALAAASTPACNNRPEGEVCSAAAQCATGACSNNVCAPVAPAAPAAAVPASDRFALLALALALLCAGLVGLGHARQRTAMP